jgi:oxygen-independent coproporphyrinogen-3 oxidase
MGYTVRGGLDLVALGASGISELAGVYAQSERDPDAWLAAVRAGGLATRRGWRLSADDERRRWLIQRVMCRGEIAPDAYAERFGEELGERVPDLAARLAPLQDDGLLERAGAGWQVTPVGRLFLRVIAMAFDAYLEPAAAESRPRFSRTV